ncbi:MAG: hypothetical protein U0L93_03820 [Bacteroidales bacterium]|nr:hypothetical protein [Bacteroidales bacterium]
MTDLVVTKFRGLEDLAYDYGYTDVIAVSEHNARRAYLEIQEKTNVKVSRFAYDEVFASTLGLVSMIIDNKGIMEDDKAYSLLYLCADVLTTICDKADMTDLINNKLTMTYEKGYVPFLFEDYADKLTSLDTMIILLLDMLITLGYCEKVKCIAYHTINGKMICHEFNRKDDNTVKAESTLTDDMKQAFSELYDKCCDGEIDCNEYVNKLYDVTENKGGSDNE